MKQFLLGLSLTALLIILVIVVAAKLSGYRPWGYLDLLAMPGFILLIVRLTQKWREIEDE